MSPRGSVVIAMVAAGLVVVAAAAIRAQDRVFRASADLVTVDVSVRKAGRPVTDLKAEDFELIDNRVPQTIASLSFQKLPIDVTMALDVSESVSGPVLAELRRAIQQTRADLAPQDRLKLMTFNMRVKRALDFTHSPQAIDTAFAQVATGGSTAMFDTLAVALLNAAPPDRRQFIVVFSDGHDTSSITDPSTLVAVAQRTTATVGFVLPLPTPPPPPLQTNLDRSQTAVITRLSPAASADRMICSALAKETGGLVVSPLPGENLPRTFKRALDDFRSSYVLYFAPTGVAREGVHALNVGVKRTGVDVRARKSYVWR